MGLKKSIGRRLFRKITRSAIDEFIQQQATADLTLDLGCGNSRYGRHYPNRIGVDITPGSGVQIIADAHHLPLPAGCVQRVVTTEMLEHTHDPQQVIDEMRRVLQPGGQALLTTRFLFPLHEAPHDYFRFTDYGLRHLFREWSSVRVEADSRPFEALGTLFQRMSYQSDFRGGRLVAWLCLLIARLLPLADRWLVHQYGDYGRSHAVTSIMANGYFVSAAKPGERP